MRHWNHPAFPPHPSVRPRPEPHPNPTMSVAVPLLSVMSSAFVPIPMGNFVLRASTRSQRSIATCISQPLPGMALASSAAISHMSLSGAEIAEEASILVVLAMFFIFLGGLYTDKQRLKPLSHLMLEPQIAGACVRACLVALSHRMVPSTTDGPANPRVTSSYWGEECVMVPTPASVLKDGAAALDDRDWWVCPPGVTPPPFLKGHFAVDNCAEVYYNGELTYACSFT